MSPTPTVPLMIESLKLQVIESMFYILHGAAFVRIVHVCVHICPLASLMRDKVCVVPVWGDEKLQQVKRVTRTEPGYKPDIPSKALTAPECSRRSLERVESI